VISQANYCSEVIFKNLYTNNQCHFIENLHKCIFNKYSITCIVRPVHAAFVYINCILTIISHFWDFLTFTAAFTVFHISLFLLTESRLRADNRELEKREKRDTEKHRQQRRPLARSKSDATEPRTRKPRPTSGA